MSSSGDSDSSEDEPCKLVQYKVVLLGDQAVGKTCLAVRLAQEDFAAIYKPTHGLDFYARHIILPTQVSASLKLWDLGSTISSVGMAANYIHGCHAVLLVYDVTQEQSFTAALEWLQLLEEMYEGVGLPYVALVANKTDLEADSVVTRQQHSSAALEHNIYSYSVSAKTGEGVLHAFFQVAADLAGIPVTAADVAAACGEEAAAFSRADTAQVTALAMLPLAASVTSTSIPTPKCGHLTVNDSVAPSSPTGSSIARRHAADRCNKQSVPTAAAAAATSGEQEEDADAGEKTLRRPHNLQHCRCCCSVPSCAIM